MSKQELTTKIHPFYTTVFVTGFAVLVLELAGARLITPYYGNTIFVWSSMIGVTIASLAIGYFIGGKLSKEKSLLIISTTIASTLTLVSVGVAPFVLEMSSALGIIYGSFVASLILFAPVLITLSVVSPMIIQRISDIKNNGVGSISGKVFGVGTIGSFVGALITGFVLIPSIPLTHIFVIIAGVLVVTSLVLSILMDRSMIHITLFATALVVITSMSLPVQEADGMIYHTQSLYSDIKVIDGDNDSRALLVDNSLQSIVAMGTGQSKVPFANHMELAYFMNPSIEDVLVLGLGSGKVSEKLEMELGSNVDTVEIDSKIVDVASEYFGFEGNVIVDDARHYIRTTDNIYDAMFYDIATGDSFPSHLFTDEAFAQTKQSLSSNGVVTIHLDGDINGKKIGSIFKTLDNNFENVFVLNGGDSILSAKVFFATDSIIDLDSMLQQVEYSRHSSGMKYTYDNIINNNLIFDLDNGIILTDDYNPMDSWQSESAETWREYTWETYGDYL